MHTLFLTPAGKIISDAFIIKPKIYRNGKVKYPNDELWIDVPAEAKNILKAHIQKYTWKKKVLLIDSEYSDDDQPKLSVYSSWVKDVVSRTPVCRRLSSFSVCK